TKRPTIKSISNRFIGSNLPFGLRKMPQSPDLSLFGEFPSKGLRPFETPIWKKLHYNGEFEGLCPSKGLRPF
ncbi:MAG: hypothetical protein D6710_07225, partial [Nitrospirae bacterium]